MVRRGFVCFNVVWCGLTFLGETRLNLLWLGVGGILRQ